MPEFTPTGILYKYNQTGELPPSMMPVESLGSLSENDPTKPLRSSLESILLARSGVKALKFLDNFWERQKKNPLIKDEIVPVAEIDQIDGWEKREDILDKKVEFLLGSFSTSMRRALVHELNPKYNGRLPENVSTAYKLLIEADGIAETINGIMEAGLSLNDQIRDLFYCANDSYHDYLGYIATIRQIVGLVGNSYDTSAQLETGFHNKAAEELNRFYIIDTIVGIDRIIILDPSLYHKVEKEMRAKGVIKDQLTHCPFAMNSRFTNPFQNPGTELVECNPLKLVFESLVNEYIGS